MRRLALKATGMVFATADIDLKWVLTSMHITAEAFHTDSHPSKWLFSEIQASEVCNSSDKFNAVFSYNVWYFPR